MKHYVYKVKSETGRIFTGETKIAGEEALRVLLQEKGYTPIEITEKNVFTDVSQISLFKPRVKLKDLAIFFRQFSIILEAGVPIAGALDVLKQQATNITLKEILNDIHEDIQRGLSLSSAMKQHDRIFSDISIHMIEAGEVSGQLDQVFIRLAAQYEKDLKLNRSIKSAMLYPIIVCVVSVLVIFVLMIGVLPVFTDTLESLNVEMPLITKIVIGTSRFFVKWWWAIIIAMASTIFFVTSYLRTYNGKRLMSVLAIRLPVVKKLVQNIATARLARTLGTLIASGVLLIQAMQITQKVLGNVIISERVEGVIEDIKMGKGLTQPLRNLRYFPPMLISMIRVGEESGNLDFSLEKSADFYDEEVEASINRLMTLMQPLIIMVLAGIVTVIILSVLLPMYSIYEGIQ
ncbi:MAG: type II secretion system F family protein [Clostridium sp.]|nr:type II secretion system F family protein [Clostridium sp.]